MSETTTPAPATATQEAEILAALGKRSIVLVGMMGAGKSTIGRRLAARLKLPFVDADTEIEAAAGMTIPEIFERHGEPHFRDGEARVIARLLDGGPACWRPAAARSCARRPAAASRDKAVSIWLKADPDIIMRRVKRRADRPLLQTADPAATVRPPAQRARAGLPACRSDDLPRATCRMTRSSMNASTRCTPALRRAPPQPRRHREAPR